MSFAETEIMAKRLNKNVVVGLTVAGMVVTTLAGILMIRSLPKQDPQPIAEQAKAASDRGDYAQAWKMYQRAAQRAKIAGDPVRRNEYYMLAGDAALASGDAQRAQRFWGEVLLDNPTHMEAQERIVKLLLEIAYVGGIPWSKVQSEAERLVEMAGKNNTKSYLGLNALGASLIQQRAVKESNAEEGKQLLIEAVNGDKSNPAYAKSLADHYLDEGDVKAAVAVYDVLMANPSKDVKLVAKGYRFRGRFYLEPAVQQKVPEADKLSLADFENAVKLTPDDVDALVSLGEYWHARKMRAVAASAPAEEIETYRSKARAEYDRAVKADYDHYSSYMQLAQLYTEDNEFDKALEVLDKRIARGVKRDHYLGWRNEQYMIMLRHAAFRINLAKLADLGEKGRDDPGTQEQFKALVDRLNQIYRETIAEMRGGANEPLALTMHGRLLMLQQDTYGAIKDLAQAQKLLPGPSPEIHRLLGQLYADSNTPGLALESLRIVLADNPNDVEARAMMATVLNQLNRPQEAQTEAERARQLDPNNRTALAALMRAYELQRNYDGIAALQKHIGVATGSVQEKLNRAMLLQLQAGTSDNPDSPMLAEAEKLLREVIAAEPTNLTALQRLVSQLNSKPETATKVPELLTTTRAEIEKRRAEAAATQPAGELAKQLQNAISGVDMLQAAADPKADPAEVLKQQEAIIRRGTDPFIVSMNLYTLYMQHGRNDQAYASLKDAYTKKPNERQVVSALFRLTLDNKDWKLAEELVDKAVALGLDPSGGRFYRGRVLMARTDEPNHLESAIKEIRQGLSAIPSYAEGLTLLGQALTAAKQYDEAQRVFEDARRLDPLNSVAAIGLALLASERGDDAEKAKYLALCAQVAPNNAWIRSELQDLEDVRDPQKGITRREDFRKQKPKDTANLLKLAALYAASDKPAEAAALYKECQQIAPQDLQIAREYVNFLTRKKSPEPKAAREYLQNLVTSIDAKEVEKKATAQLLLAGFLRNQFQTRAPEAPKLEEVDAAFEAALTCWNAAPVMLDIGNYFLRSNRPQKAEDWFRKAVSAADSASQENMKQNGQRLLVQSLLSRNDPKIAPLAQKEIDHYREMFPNDNTGLILQAEYYNTLGRDDEAIKVYTDFITKEPQKPLGLYNRGLTYYRQSEWGLAAQDLKEVKRLAPTLPTPRLLLAYALENSGQQDAAVSELQSILQENVAAEAAMQQLFSLYLKMKRYESAESLIDSYSRNDPKSVIWDGYRVQIAKARGDNEAAVRHALAGVDKTQGNPVIVDTLLDLYISLGQYDNAVTFITTKLPAERQKDLLVKARLASAYLGQKNVKKGLDLYYEVPNPDTAQFGGYIELFRTAIIPEKVAVLQELRQRVAANVQDRLWKHFLALAEAANANYQASAGILRELLASLPTSEKDSQDPKVTRQRQVILQQLAMQLYNQKQYPEARKAYEQLLEIDPNNVEALNNLAYMLLEHFQDAQAALEYSRRAVILIPDSAKMQKASVMDTLGWNHVLLGNYGQAIVTLQKTVEAASQVPAVHYHLAEAFFRRSQVKNSMTQDSDLKRAKQEVQEAYTLIRTAGADDEHVLPKLVELGTKMDLKLDPNISSKPAS